jgi:alkylation response protein AidB-like acyl-CoA dehydrogenase
MAPAATPTIAPGLPFDDAGQRDFYAGIDQIASEELEPHAAAGEASGAYPRDLVTRLSRAGVPALPFPRQWGGGGQSYVFYCQVLERLARGWFAVAESLHLQVLACHGVAAHGTQEQRQQFLGRLLAGDALGATCMSEPDAGSDLAAISTRAWQPDGAGEYVVTGTKAWVSHAGIADLYNVYCRTGSGSAGLTCLLVEATAPGVVPQPHERKMAVNTIPTAQVRFEDVRVPADRVIGRKNRGLLVAATVFDHGRLGIASCAVGLAQAALDHAARYAAGRVCSGTRLIDEQGTAFMLADMATAVAAARALLHAAARLRDAGRPFGIEASKAKLFATDTAMRVTTDVVQILGSAGYTSEHPAERWMREAKLLQIIDGTNQIQRAAIARSL